MERHAPKNTFGLAISILGQRQHAIAMAVWFVGFFALYSFISGFWLFPGIGFGFVRMTNIQWFDILYVVLVSALAGLLVVLLKYKSDGIKSEKRFAGIGGFVAGIFGAACPACQTISLAALGSTFFAIPLGPLIPYLWVFRIVGLLALTIGSYLVLDSIYTKTCKPATKSILKPLGLLLAMVELMAGGPAPHHAHQTHAGQKKGPFIFENNFVFGLLVALVALLAVNGVLINSASASSAGGSVTLSSDLNYGPITTLKPMPLAAGESPRIAGYKSIVKALPTISELPIKAPTGNIVQDLVNNIVPHGTPRYGAEAGVSFDDPLTAQKLWSKARAIQLDAGQQKRWSRIVNSFTCDYCCGSPQNPTIITRCGCAHSYAAQGMARWFIKNYGDSYSDEQIYGEMARWYALWYPGPTVKRIVQELQTGK